MDFSKFSDEDLKAYEAGNYAALSDDALNAIDAHEKQMADISAKMRNSQSTNQNFGLITPGATIAGTALGGAIPRTVQSAVDLATPQDLRGGFHTPTSKAPVNPTVAPVDTSYHSPFGAGQGAVKNATHNVDEILKNRATQAALNTPGFTSPGNSLLLLPESVVRQSTPTVPATPPAPPSLKARVGETLPQARAFLQSQDVAPAHRLGTAFKTGMVGGFGANTAENIAKGNYGDAATSAVGTGTALAAMSSNPKIAKLGKLGLAASLANKAYQTTKGWKPQEQPVQEKAAGGIIQAGLEALKKANAAGKSGARLTREAAYVHDIAPTHQFGEAPKLSIQDLQGKVLVGVPGDRSLTGHEVRSIAGVPLSKSVEQHGGPRYGQKQLEEGKQNFWASQLGAANSLQNKTAKAVQETGMDPYGLYVAMAPESSAYALHHTESLLNQLDALNPRKKDIEAFNKEIRQQHPAFFGLTDPEVMEQLRMNPEMRKLIAERLNKQSYYNELGLPSGEATIHAITEPALRDVATGTTGFSVGKLDPHAKLSVDTEGLHPTYNTQIPGEFKGEMIAQLPWEFYFPEAAKQIASNPKQAPHAFGTFKMGQYHQPVTQEMIDTIAPIEEQLLKGYAGGGLTKKAIELAKKIAPDFSLEAISKMPVSSAAKQKPIASSFLELANPNVDPKVQAKIFADYLQHNPELIKKSGATNYNELTEAAYKKLSEETKNQFDEMVGSGVKIHWDPTGEKGYRSSKDMLEDALGNNNLVVYQGGELHPLLGQEGNDKFRAVHDYFGHGTTGSSFGPKGEELAYGAHSQMYSPLARLAAASETRGQNSVVNYSGINDELIKKMAELKAQGRFDEAAELGKQWQYAPQKPLILPHKFLDLEYNGKQFAEGGQIQGYAGGELVKKGITAVAKPVVDRINMHYKDVTKRIPELQESANKMLAGVGSREEHEALVNAFKPVKPFDFVPQPATREEAINALHANKKELYGVPSQTLQPGYPVGLRLDIPAYSDHGVWVPTIHEQASGFGAGKTIGHESVASVLNPAFGMSDKAALSIASGKPKGTIATIKGEWNPVDNEKAVANAQEYLNHPDWVQVGMDPERHGYFYDRATMEPITHAEEALQIGPLVLAKKPVYGNKEDFKFADGGLAHLKEGGHTTPAWQRKEGKNPEGGLNAKGRASYNRETGGHLKAPQPEGGARRDSFCARMEGMKKKNTSSKTANDPDSRINKSLRKWKC